MTGQGTNTYVLGRGAGVVVIDPGPAIPEHLENVQAAVRARGHAAHVLVTHHHVDHVEAAVELAAALGAQLAGIPHPDGPTLDRELRDGEVLESEGVAIRVLATPGHARDHACFLWEQEDAVFAGDLVAGAGFIVIDPPDGNMADYLGSLAAVRDLPGRSGTGLAVLLPGHGPAIEDPRGYLDAYIAHRLQREAQVLAAVPGQGGLPAEALLPIAYSDTPEAMYPVASRSLEAHLDKLVGDGRVEFADGVYRRRG